MLAVGLKPIQEPVGLAAQIRSLHRGISRPWPAVSPTFSGDFLFILAADISGFRVGTANTAIL
jgi:hypothetical protein